MCKEQVQLTSVYLLVSYLKIQTLKYTCCLTWTSNLVFQPKERTLTTVAGEQSSKENIWSCKTGSDTRMENII